MLYNNFTLLSKEFISLVAKTDRSLLGMKLFPDDMMIDQWSILIVAGNEIPRLCLIYIKTHWRLSVYDFSSKIHDFF